MRLRTDDRAVTVQIGTVLLFAVLIVLLSTYQATVVPQQNERVEFNHNQQIQGDLQDLRDELFRAGATGSGGSASVALGTQYPVRAFFVNPPPPSGTLRTTDAANVTIENAVASGEVRDYWNGDRQNFSTRGLLYEPNYHEYQRPPTTVYRSGVLYNRFDGANITLAGQQLIRGNTISLIAVGGSLSESSSGTAGVNMRPVSTATRTVTVHNESSNVTLVVPSKRDADEWRTDLLDEQMDEDGTNADRYVSTVEDTTVDGQSAVRIVLENGTYDLRLAKVGIGSDVTDTGAHYITDVRGDNASISAGGSQQLVVEVRDRFNNPVSGATVNVNDDELSDDESVTPQRAETDADGRATFLYDASGTSGTRTVTFNISDDPEPREEVTFSVHVSSPGGGGNAGGNGSDGAYWTRWENASIHAQPGMTCYANDTCRYDISYGESVTLTANTTPSATDATVEFSVNDTAVAAFEVGQRETGTDGRAAVNLDTTVTETPETVNVYAASGGSGDALTVVVTDSSGGPPTAPDPTLNWSVTDNTDVSGNGPQYSVSYNVSNAWSSFDHVEVEFRNLDSSELTETVSSSATRDTVEYSAGYGAGDTYNVTIRALATNGSVLEERSVVDVADSDDPSGDDDLGGSDSPELAGRWITDASDSTDGAVYDASYNLTNRDNFDRVEIEFRNLGDDSATRTVTLHQPRGRASYAPDYGNGQEYEIVFRVYDSNGLKVDDLTVSDVADGDEPEGNVLLANATSPTLTNVDVSDVSESWDSRFEVAYEVSDPSETFGSVEVEYKNLDTGETVETDVATATNGQVQLDAYQENGDEFDITVRVYDESGAIVDVETVTDTGDGTDPQ